MSLDILRQNALSSRRHDLTNSARRLRSQQRALRRISHFVSSNGTLTSLLNTSFDAGSSPPPDSEESAWLNENDIVSGRYFNEGAIPYPALPDDNSKYPSKPNRPPNHLPERANDAAAADAPASDGLLATAADPTSSAEATSVAATQEPTSTQSDVDEDEPPTPTYAQRAADEVDGPVALPYDIAPPEPDEEAQLDGKTKRLMDLERPERPAKVVHLPPEDAEDENQRRRSVDVEQGKASRTHLQTEVASSPSSTVGAYSTATPLPPQDSPDTSPDSETSERRLEVPPPKDMQPSEEEQREQEAHDRLLEAQKEIARRQALGDVSSADDQLKWEEREAAARDAEERAAREDMNGPEPNANDVLEETQAEAVMDDVEAVKESEETEDSVPNVDSNGVGQSGAPEEQTAGLVVQEDGDNITVTPRNKQQATFDPAKAYQRSVDVDTQPLPGDQDRMTTRTSSGALQKRSVSEILGQTPASTSRRDLILPGEVSPSATRYPFDTSAGGSSTSPFQTSRRPTRTSTLPRMPSTSQSALDDLSTLKGAAEDPDRDYLEPLFRIQAHDMPQNIHTAALPELVRSATKALSTDDHFTSLHERLDYRILRRIYQLQNANKWSLRQMERCNEVDQPVTHHDHMMAEMQWMRKDFKAERKMKKNVCAWLARRCADWVAASADERKKMQVQVQPPRQRQNDEEEEQMPDLEQSGERTPIEATPLTPTDDVVALLSNLIIPPDLSEVVSGLESDGKLNKALKSLPIIGLSAFGTKKSNEVSLDAVSKFVDGKVLPTAHRPNRKRSRYDYEDDAELLESQRDNKRLREWRDLTPQDTEIALFNHENKHLRERLHSQNAFRPPSEFPMPSAQFYEFRNGSQWLWEDDQKVRKAAKEYSFNWSLISDELQLPGIFKSSAERRTPWECFERWVELDQMPTDMRKTMYFKAWFQRLEQSQQAAERRYQAQLTALQAQSNGNPTHVPLRRKITPQRVDKRKNTRYLWMVDAIRKVARKKESQAFKQAETQRAAAQRKAQSDQNPQRQVISMTPQELSKKRYQRDVEAAERQRLQMQQALEMRQRQILAARQSQQGMPNGNASQQRPGSSSNVPAPQGQVQSDGQQQVNMNGQVPQQQRSQIPMSTRNGHLAVPPVNGQAIPQAQMRSNGPMPNPQDMQRIAQANVPARNAQFGGQQPYQIPNPNMMSPGNGMTAQQQMQSNQAMLASMHQHMNSANHQGSHQASGSSHSPSMPPPPTPQTHPQQLSSGHVPALLGIRNKIRQQFPQYTDEQVNAFATEMLKSQSQSQSSNQARQSAMNAAAGITGAPPTHGGNMQAYGHNQAVFQNNQMPNGTFPTDPNGPQPSMSPASQQQYAALMRARQMQQMRLQSPNATHATLNGSPSLTNASPAMAPVSPNMQYANMNHGQMAAAMNMGGINAQQQRPSSRSATPQMQRLPSSGSMPGMGSPQGMNGVQGSPRNVQAGMAR